MNEDLKNINEENNESGQFELTGEVLETVEFTLAPPAGGTHVTCKDPDGLDQRPIPSITSEDERYAIDKVTVNGIQRDEIYWREYSTLVYYSDVKMKKGETYTVFGKVKAAPGYIFNDPATLIINGEEVSPMEIEDYSLEGDSFTFYFDIKVV